jgi:hypothetical protein
MAIATYNSKTNDKPGSLLAEKQFRQALDRTKMPASAQKIGGFLVGFYNVGRGFAYPSIPRIAFESTCDEVTVHRALKGPLAGWFRIETRMINGKQQNVYFPNWVKADAANREFEIRLSKWRESRKTADGGDESIPLQNAESPLPTPCKMQLHPLQNAASPPAKCNPIELVTELTIESKSLVAKATRSTDDEIDQAFEERFWPTYPKRTGPLGKPEAKTRFRKAVRSGAADAEKIMAATEKLAAHWTREIERKPDQARYIPKAETWLKKRGWDDVLGAPRGGETIFDLAAHFENQVKAQPTTHEFMQGAPI